VAAASTVKKNNSINNFDLATYIIYNSLRNCCVLMFAKLLINTFNS